MEQRRPLEVFGGRGKKSLRIEDDTVVLMNKHGQEERRVPIADIKRVQTTLPSVAIASYGTLGITTKFARKTIFGTDIDIVLFFKHPSELPYAEEIKQYILDFLSELK